jgi:protein phosphatase 1 regulatory subunit 7
VLSTTQAEGIGHLTALTLLELGSNRLRELGPIAGLTGLQELWLGRNRLASLDGMSQ